MRDKTNQRTTGPVNAHLLSGATVSTKQVSQNLTLSLNGPRSTQGHHLYKHMYILLRAKFQDHRTFCLSEDF